MGDPQSWLMFFGVLAGGMLVTFLGITLFVLTLIGRSPKARSARWCGLAGGVLAVLGLALALFSLATDGSGLYSSPASWTPLTFIILLMVIGLPAVSLGFGVGAGFGFLVGKRRRAWVADDDEIDKPLAQARP